MKILIDTSPLANANSTRGVGAYTRFLTQELEKINDIDLKTSFQPGDATEFKPEVVHYPYFDLFFLTLPVIQRQPTVVTVHDVIPLRFPEFYPPGVRGRLKLEKQKIALKQAAAVITDSESSKQDIVRFLHISADKVNVVYLAANPKLKTPSQSVVNQVRRKYDLPQIFGLYVGDINYNKNLPGLIASLKYLPDEFRLVLVGRSFKPQKIPEWQRIERQMALSDVAGRVKFLNEITGDANQELSAIYAAAAAYIQPSLYEGFGLPVLEAMQCQTPVVATNTSSLKEVAKGHAVFVGTEAEQIAAGIQTVLDWNNVTRSQVIKAGFEWSQSFSWKQTAHETYQIYQQVLA